MKAHRFLGVGVAILLGGIGAIGSAPVRSAGNGGPPPVKLNTTADHGKFKELQRNFTSGPENSVSGTGFTSCGCPATHEGFGR